MILFFFQAEDGIRDFHVTGVQTCALPISFGATASGDLWSPYYRITVQRPPESDATISVNGIPHQAMHAVRPNEIGRASCRERVERAVEAGRVKNKKREDMKECSNDRSINS